MYRGFWLREARSVLFYEGLGLCGGAVIKRPKSAGGSAKENPSRAWGALSWDHMRIS